MTSRPLGWPNHKGKERVLTCWQERAALASLTHCWWVFSSPQNVRHSYHVAQAVDNPPPRMRATRRSKNTWPHNNLYTNVNNGMIHNSYQVEKPQTSINRYMNKQWNIIGNKKKNEQQHGWTWKPLCCVKEASHRRPHSVRFYLYEKSRIGNPDRQKSISGCLWPGRLERRKQWQPLGVEFLRRDENVLELTVVMAQLCEYAKKQWIVQFKLLYCMVCE